MVMYLFSKRGETEHQALLYPSFQSRTLLWQFHIDAFLGLGFENN